MGTIIIPVAIVAVLLILAFGSSRMKTARALVRGWAEKMGFTLLRLERRDFFQGPFFFRSGKTQFVYYLVVMDRGGHRRKGFIRVGSFWLGCLTSESIAVRWVK